MRELSDQEQQLIIDKLNAEMRRLGCENQKEFARIIGISPSFLNLILSGKRLGYRSLKTIANKLNRPVDWFTTPMLAEEAPLYCKTVAIDEILMNSVITKSLNLIKKLKKPITPSQMATLFIKIYTHFYETGEAVDDFEIEKYLTLL